MEPAEALPQLEAALRPALERAPASLDLRAIWDTFKIWATRPVPADTDFSYVGFGVEHEDDGEYHLTFIRQFCELPSPCAADDALDDEGDEATGPAHEIVVDVAYPAEAAAGAERFELASGDFDSFDQFVAAVEASPAFARLLSRGAGRVSVYEDRD